MSMDFSHHTSDPGTVELSLVHSRADTNSTADDLPGPGRTLDKAYTIAGRRVELFLSKSAERLGYGPRVTAQRIRRRRKTIDHSFRHYDGRPCLECHDNGEGFIRSPTAIKAEANKLKKDIKYLLKCVNSKVPSTKKQAMDHILDLSVSDYNVLALLKAMGATQIISVYVQIYFRFGYFDDDLLDSSRKALISLGDAEINTLLREWTIFTTGDAERPDNIDRFLISLWDKIAPYLDDCETAFLVMRFLRKTIDYIFSDSVLECVISSVGNSPNYFEWEQCEAAFYRAILMIYELSDEIQSSLGEFFLRYADRMPRVLKSKEFQMLSINVTEMNSDNFVYIHSTKGAFVQAVICAGRDGEHTLPLDALKRRYTCPGLQPLLGSLACPLERVVMDFVVDDPLFRSSTPTSAELRVYNEMARYVDTSYFMLRAKAWDYANYFMALDMYRCDMMLQALSTTDFATTENFSSFAKMKKDQCIQKGSRDNAALAADVDTRSVCGSTITATCSLASTRMSPNQTSDDLTGPGRTIDTYVLQPGGRFIERIINPIIAKAEDTQDDGDSRAPQDIELESGSISTDSSGVTCSLYSSRMSSNQTGDDLPGIGRIVDTYLYQAGGRFIERRINHFFTKRNLRKGF